MQRLVALIRAVRRRTTGDRGAILIFTALGLVVFMVFAAVAVDLSALFATRRHAQTVVDVGILAGAQFAGAEDASAINPSPQDLIDYAQQAVIDKVKDITATNLGLTNLESDVAWANCSDPDGVADGFVSKPLETACISFTVGMSKIRVRLPDQTMDTFFAGVIGVNTLTTHASAVVEALINENGDILPFGTPTGQASATIGCPADHPNGLLPCDGPSSGNFNHLAVPQWGLDPPPSQKCSHTNKVYEDNIADGVDHLLGLWSFNPVIDGKDLCETPNVAMPPGAVNPNTGVAKSTLVNGMVGGTTNFPGRLRDTVRSALTATVIGKTVDNTPLWEFIVDPDPAIGFIPDSCKRNSFNGSTRTDWDEDVWVEQGLDPRLDDPEYDGNFWGISHKELPGSFEHMARCLRDYSLGVWYPGSGPHPDIPYPVAGYDGAGYAGPSGSAPMFTRANDPNARKTKGIYDLQLMPRWGWSPVGDFGSGTSAPFEISAFIPVYINTLVGNCSGGPTGGCGWIWHAGDATPPGSPSGDKLDSLISFQLPISALPATVFKFGPGAEIDTPYVLVE